MAKTSCKLLLGVWIFVLACGCAPHASRSQSPATVPSSLPSTTVVWISIDGLRHDYVDRAHAPALTLLKSQGAYTNRESPIFPTLTFPNHAAQVTGTCPDQNGIPSNNFYDRATGKSYNLPGESDLYRAEPIWITAKRQGLRVAVIDWPMSSGQTGEFKSDYCAVKYDSRRSDRQRLESVLETLKNDRATPRLRLIITYLSGVDHAGHKYGPDSPEVDQAVLEADEVVDDFLKGVIEWFNATHASGDELYAVITTDHGMEPVTHTVSLDTMLGPDLASGAKLITSGPTANIYLIDVPETEQAARSGEIAAKLRENSFAKAWTASEVPARLHYSDPTRVGDVVVLLEPGYTFNRSAATRPSFNPQLGMHGYETATCPNMRGTAIVWRYRHSSHGKDLGPIDNTQWHATVARLLGIEPSKKADPRAINLN